MPCTRCAKQVSVFLENKPGRLTDVCRVLGDAGVNIRAFCVAEASEFGILRLIADKPGVAAETLAAKGYAVTEHEVLAVQLQDRPGDLARALTALSGAGINVEHLRIPDAEGAAGGGDLPRDRCPSCGDDLAA